MSQEPNSNKSDGAEEDSSTTIVPNSTSRNTNNTSENTSRHTEGKYRGRENFLSARFNSTNYHHKWFLVIKDVTFLFVEVFCRCCAEMFNQIFFTDTNDPVKREETPFSLKHFLKRDMNLAKSTQPDYGQKSTGARPKIPMHIGVDNAKMKRSPKFSSFDSQASLAEFSSASASTSLPNANDNSTLTNACQSSTYDLSESPSYHNDTAAHFQRSFSTYEMGGGRRLNNASAVNSQHHFDMLLAPRSPKTVISPEMSSALPDFVQDHILVENYHNMAPNTSSTTSMQLPDFTLNSHNNTLSR